MKIELFFKYMWVMYELSSTSDIAGCLFIIITIFIIKISWHIELRKGSPPINQTGRGTMIPEKL